MSKPKRSKKLGYLNPNRSKWSDMDYIDDLDDDALEYIKQFDKEYYGSSFDKDVNKRINKSPDAYKDSYDRDNASRRDTTNKASRLKNEFKYMDHDDINYIPPKNNSNLKATLKRRLIKTLKRLVLY